MGFHPAHLPKNGFSLVRKGFVEKPEHWKYNGARNVLLSDDSIININRIMVRG
jgi:hypothetical protein